MSYSRHNFAGKGNKNDSNDYMMSAKWLIRKRVHHELKGMLRFQTLNSGDTNQMIKEQT